MVVLVGRRRGGLGDGLTLLWRSCVICCNWWLSESVRAGMGEFLEGFWRIFKISFVAAMKSSESEIFGMLK